MAHADQLQFVQLISQKLPMFFRDCRVLEIGSLDISGSVRRMFSRCEYVGIDVGEGPGVDVICEGQNWSGPDDDFDAVISCEVMEHNPHWVKTFANMVRVCKPNGLVLMTCATTGRAEHGTTRTDTRSSPLTVAKGWDYYKNLTANDFARALDLTQLFADYRFWTSWGSYDLYFVGIKRARTVELPTSHAMSDWSDAINEATHYVQSRNCLKIHLARQWAARLFGDPYFVSVRRLIRMLHYVHD